MKKIHNKYYLLLAFLIMFSLFVARVSAESNQGNNNSRSSQDNSQISVGVSQNDDDDEGDDIEDFQKGKNKTASTTATSSDDNDDDSDDDSDSSEGRGDEHRSRIATLVKSLLSIADRDGGIGEEVRIVAREQASTSDEAQEDIDEINSESSLKRFFFGTDYKSLGDLRSTIITTQNHINRLSKALERATSTSTKTDLSDQISELEEVASSTQEFIDDNENRFSLFGWFVRLFLD